MLIYLIISILIAASAFTARNERHLFVSGVLFYAVQVLFTVWILVGAAGATSLGVFQYDDAGTLFFILLTVVSAFAYSHSRSYLQGSGLHCDPEAPEPDLLAWLGINTPLF